jgi:predicted glycoside hydrolase/deacetylase ChbG (UPF0249 family)
LRWGFRGFPLFLTGAGDGFLVMCHPGHSDAELRAVDSLTDQRETEYAYFLSDDFPEALNRADLRLGRFWAGSGTL